MLGIQSFLASQLALHDEVPAVTARTHLGLCVLHGRGY